MELALTDVATKAVQDLAGRHDKSSLIHQLNIRWEVNSIELGTRENYFVTKAKQNYALLQQMSATGALGSIRALKGIVNIFYQPSLQHCFLNKNI